MKRLKSSLLALTLVAGALALPGAASATQTPPPSDEVDFSSPFPATMTNEEMAAISSGDDGVLELNFPSNAEDSAGSNRPSARSVPIGVSAERCYISPGNMWVRKSGTGYKYGTVGSKPALTGCTPGVTKTGMTNEVWMHNGWIWFRAAGPFVSQGPGNYQTKKVKYICKGNGVYPFKVITFAWGTNSRGQTGTARDSTGEYKFSCD